MRVLNYSVHNVLKISEVDLKMDGANLVLVGGKNGQGKTSAIKALLMALCGKSGMDWPDVSLKEGEAKGWVRVELSGDEEMQDTKGFTVELLLKRKRGGEVVEEFRVLDSAGEEAPEPRALLKRLYEFRAFDPLSFERAKPKERADLLRKLVGLDFTEIDKKRKEIYDLRTDVNRQGKSLAARREAIKFPEDTPNEKVSVVALVAKKEEAVKHNRELDKQSKQHMDLTDEGTRLIEEREKLQQRIAKIDEAMKEHEIAFIELNKKVAAARYIDVEVIQKQIEDSETTNLHVDKFIEANRIDTELHTLRVQSQKMSDQIDRLDKSKQERLEAAKWPLPGMSLDESGVLFDGLPFEQASKAQRVMASVNVGMALNPKLRLLVCEDGNDLDNDTLAALEKMLVANDFQMVLEFVTRSQDDEDRCAVVFSNGKAKKPPTGDEIFTGEGCHDSTEEYTVEKFDHGFDDGDDVDTEVFGE